MNSVLTVALKWSIKDFRALCQDDHECFCIESPEFYHNFNSQLKFSLHLYPNERNTEYSNFTSLFLCLNSYQRECLVLVKLSLLEPDGAQWNMKVAELVVNSGQEYGLSQWIMRDYLLEKQNKFLHSDGSLVVYCEITTLKDSTNFLDSSSDKNQTLQSLKSKSHSQVQIWKSTDHVKLLSVPNQIFHEFVEPNKDQYQNSFRLLNNIRKIVIEKGFVLSREFSNTFVNTKKDFLDDNPDQEEKLDPYSLAVSNVVSNQLILYQDYKMPLTKHIEFEFYDGSESFIEPIVINSLRQVSIPQSNQCQSLDNSLSIEEIIQDDLVINTFPSINQSSVPTTPLPPTPLPYKSIPQSSDQYFGIESILSQFEKKLLRKLRKTKLSKIILNQLNKTSKAEKNNYIYNFRNANLQNVILNTNSSESKFGNVNFINQIYGTNLVNYFKKIANIYGFVFMLILGFVVVRKKFVDK